MDRRCASRYARFTSRCRRDSASSRLKSWTTLIPVIRSWRKAFSRARRTLTSRYTARILARKRKAAHATRGSTLKETRASLQSIRSMATTMKTRVKTSPKTVTIPEAKSSFSVSTSFVIRVMRRPTGFRS